MHVQKVERNVCDLPPLDAIKLTRDGFVADYFNLQLSSAYQPIFSFAHRRPVGYEALLRARLPDDELVLPEQIFSIVRGHEDIIQLDLLTREVHARNFISQHPSNSWLFLNVSPEVFINAPRCNYFEASLPLSSRLVPYRIVIEVVESAIDDEAALLDSIRYYRKHGCLIALDDFGAGHSNFGRVWSLEPDIVKLDRNLTQQAGVSKKSRRMLASLVAMLHESGCLVVMEGIETEAEAMAAMSADIDMAQGYFFARPNALIPNPDSYAMIPSDLGRKYRDSFVSNEHRLWRQKLAWPLQAFQESARALEADQLIEAACSRLLRHEGVECSYLLTDDGVQVGMNVVSQNGSKVCDPRYAPLFNTQGANWYRRPFFQNAINNPGHVQISTPYLSLTGSYMCVTFSIAIIVAQTPHVFCCDVNSSRIGSASSTAAQ